MSKYFRIKTLMLKGEKGEKGDAYIITESDKQEIKESLSGDISELKDELKTKLSQPSEATVGQIFKVQSVNEDGTLVLEAVDMPTVVGTDLDVLINGVSIVVDGVANIPKMENNRLGVSYVSGIKGIWVSENGEIDCNYSTNYTNRLNTTYERPISDKKFDRFLKEAMTDGKGETWTADEQAAARERIGIHKVTQAEYDALTDTRGIYVIVEE